MRSPWRRVAAVLLSLLVPLAGCSEDDVTFPPLDAGNDAVAETGTDVSVDAVDAGRDAPDVSIDQCCIDVVTRDDGADTGTPEAPTSEPDASPDTPPPDVPLDNATVDVPTEEGPRDAASEPAPDADDGSRDAVSEEAGTCGSHCASGVCDMNDNCTPCVKDDECTGGRVCNAGTCGPRCGDGGVACTGNLVCCTEHCVDITRDPQHCGACGATCTAQQFCGNAATPTCKENLLRNICNSKKATFLLDGFVDDDAASNVIKSAITALCVPVPVLTSVNQTVSVAINTTTGQPLTGGGELLVAAGGDSTQLLVNYLEDSRTSAVYNQEDVTSLEWRLRGGATDGGDSVIRRVDRSTITPTHDYFLAEVVKDPISGTFSLIVYGIDSAGTRAGAFYFANVMLPSIVGADVTTFTQAWYIYEWTSSSSPDAGPSLGDTFMPVASGM